MFNIIFWKKCRNSFSCHLQKKFVTNLTLKGLSIASRISLNVVSTDGVLLNVEAVEIFFPAGFSHPLSCERPFKFKRLLGRAVRIDRILAILSIIMPATY